jgi:acetyl-CoA carboxylase biotin carboxyl carrier protein
MKLTDIQKMIKDFEGSNLTELSIEFEEAKIKLSKNSAQTFIPQAVPQAVSQVLAPIEKSMPLTSEPSKNSISSPLVGTYYSASSPTSKPFVEVGKQVKKGDVLCLIEAMKIMNEITATKDGVITKIHALNGQVVGMEDPLFDME